MTEPTDDATSLPSVELSIIIAAFNAEATIVEQLTALVEQEWSGTWEVIVADNGSTDATASVVQSFAAEHPAVRYLWAGGHKGPAFARNVGVDYASGSLLAFCDADDIVGPAWIRGMGDGLRRSPVVSGPQDQELLNPPWLRNVYGGAPGAQVAQKFAGVFPFGAGSCLGVRRDAFEAAGRFDKDVYLAEDIDLCLRLWHLGYTLEFVQDALIHYRNRATLMGLWKQSVAYGAAGPLIARRLEAVGGLRLPAWKGAKNWLWLLRKLPMLRTPSGRARWVVVAGTTTGRLRGSVRHRYLCL